MIKVRIWKGDENGRWEITDGIFQADELPEYPNMEEAIEGVKKDWLTSEAATHIEDEEWGENTVWLHFECDFYCDPEDRELDIEFLIEEEGIDEDEAREQLCEYCERSEWIQVEVVEDE